MQEQQLIRAIDSGMFELSKSRPLALGAAPVSMHANERDRIVVASLAWEVGNER